jgi:hypothetical protein
MKMTENTRAIILLLIMIAIGGIVMYGEKIPNNKYKTQINKDGTPR